MNKYFTVGGLLLIVFLYFPLVALSGGLDPWQFGMSKEQVMSFKQFGPYEEVKVTGGIETFNGIFDGRKANIAFAFGSQGLQRIYVIIHEGRNIDEATSAWMLTYSILNRDYGEIETPGITLEESTTPIYFQALFMATRAYVGVFGKAQMAPKKMPNDKIVFASFVRIDKPGGPYYGIRIHFDPPNP